MVFQSSSGFRHMSVFANACAMPALDGIRRLKSEFTVLFHDGRLAIADDFDNGFNTGEEGCHMAGFGQRKRLSHDGTV